MNKKKLPRAIRPEDRRVSAAIAADTPEHLATLHEADDDNLETTEDSIAADGAVLPDVAGPIVDTRRARATKLVERFSVWSGVVGLIPVPFVDLAAVGGVQIEMLRRISQIYDVPFSKNRGRAVIAGLAGSMIPATTGIGMASFVKTLPLVGTAVGAIATPALSVGATYAIGMVFVQHFATGGTLLDFAPPDYHEFIKAQVKSRHNRSKVTASASN
jgi:uncharacterized protein (DUF697 family)